MRKILLLLLLLTSAALARPTHHQITPGKSLGSLALGQPLETALKFFSGWSYTVDDDYAIGPYYIFPQESKSSLVQFILGFDSARNLRDIEIHDAGCSLAGHPEVHLGCTMAAVTKALGPGRRTGDSHLEYSSLGIRFMFEDGSPPRAQDPHRVAKFSKGQCQTIQIYRP